MKDDLRIEDLLELAVVVFEDGAADEVLETALAEDFLPILAIFLF